MDFPVVNSALDAEDAYLNAILHPTNPGECLDHVIQQVRQLGVTEKQLRRFQAKAIGMGLTIPDSSSRPSSRPKLEQVHIVAEDRFRKISDHSAAQNVMDQFGMLIYGKKFNWGVHGAFGVAQQIQADSKDKVIILHFPESYRKLFELDRRFINYYTAELKLVLKVQNSMNHYCNAGNGRCRIVYDEC